MSLESKINNTKVNNIKKGNPIVGGILKAITYPIIGLLPAKVRLQLQESDFVKKYDLSYKIDAARTSYYTTMLASLYVVPKMMVEFMHPELVGLGIGAYFLYLMGNAMVRGDDFHNGNKYVKTKGKYKSIEEINKKIVWPYSGDYHYAPYGSIFTEVPYRIYESAKNGFKDVIDYIRYF